MDETPPERSKLTPGPPPARTSGNIGSPVRAGIAWTLFLIAVGLTAAAIWAADWRLFWTALPVAVAASIMHPARRP